MRSADVRRLPAIADGLCRTPARACGGCSRCATRRVWCARTRGRTVPSFVRIGDQAFSGAIVQRADQALIAVVVVAFKTDPLKVGGPPQSRVAGSQECFGIGLNLAQFVTRAGGDNHGWVELTANLMDLDPQGVQGSRFIEIWMQRIDQFDLADLGSARDSGLKQVREQGLAFAAFDRFDAAVGQSDWTEHFEMEWMFCCHDV
jgi:hypothetical protein